MKKIYILLSLILTVTFLTGCNSGKQGNNTNSNNNTTESSIADRTMTDQSDMTNDINNTNQNIKVKEIDTVMIKEELLDQMIQDGVYALDDGKQLAVVFVNKKGYEYDTEVYANNTDIYVRYETEISDDIEPRIDDDAYLINGYTDNVMIKIYKDGKEIEFNSVIPCESIFK